MASFSVVVFSNWPDVVSRIPKSCSFATYRIPEFAIRYSNAAFPISKDTSYRKPCHVSLLGQYYISKTNFNCEIAL